MAIFRYDDIDSVIDEMSRRRQQDEAFAEALKALFDQYRVPALHSKGVGQSRSVAASSARKGAYRSSFYPAEKSKAWKVPLDQLVAIHTLIYG